MSISVAQFSAQLTASGLLTPAEVEEVRAALQPPQAEAFARALVRLQKLTPFQAQQCLAGKGKSLVLGNYVLLEKLGQGGMGMVLKAQHRRMKRIVALKVLSPAVARSPELVARFQREMEAAARLSHPNIVAAYDANEAGGLFFLVMEYVEGQDLSTRVKTQGPLPLGQALEYIVQAARGLEYAHQQGVIHRDIKPANLLLTREGTVKILDMGLARLEGETGSRAELTSTGAVMGTVDYMAPEQALSTKKADARSDVYSLGITLWYLLTGRPPYEGDSLMSRLLAHRESPIPSLCQVASGHPPDAQWSGVDAVFRRMVAKRPEDRFQSMTEVITALERCRHGAVPQPGAAVGPSEDRRLNDVLSHSEKESGSQTVPLAPTSATLPLSPGMVSEATLTSAEPEFPTDPQTEVQPLLLPRTLRRTSMRPGGPAWRRPGVIAGGAAGLLLVAGLTWWLLAGRKATSSREEVSTLTTAAAPGAPRSPPRGPSHGPEAHRGSRRDHRRRGERPDLHGRSDHGSTGLGELRGAARETAAAVAGGPGTPEGVAAHRLPLPTGGDVGRDGCRNGGRTARNSLRVHPQHQPRGRRLPFDSAVWRAVGSASRGVPDCERWPSGTGESGRPGDAPPAQEVAAAALQRLSRGLIGDAGVEAASTFEPGTVQCGRRSLDPLEPAGFVSLVLVRHAGDGRRRGGLFAASSSSAAP